MRFATGAISRSRRRCHPYVRVQHDHCRPRGADRHQHDTLPAAAHVPDRIRREPVGGGMMLLVYMAGNLSMKSVTTPILHRFGFRDVSGDGRLCALRSSRAASCRPRSSCRGLRRAVLAGMTRSMNFTSMSTLAFADVPRSCGRAPRRWRRWRSRPPVRGRGDRSPGTRPLSDAGRGATWLSDFQNALFVAAGLMGLAVLWSLRLPANAGTTLRRREAGGQ